MTIAAALKLFPTIEADLLLSHVLRKPKEFLYIYPETEISAASFAQYKKLAIQRKKEVPIAYLLGYKDFFGLRFKVTPDVLIPRPEGEWLVEEAIQYIKKSPNKTWRILDMGTGSGCLIIAVAKALPKIKFELVGADISAPALRVARANAKKHGVTMAFKQSDLFSKVSGHFDIIFANLPYVPPTTYVELKSDLKYEPKVAITHKNVSLLYQDFLLQSSQQVNKKHLILLEIDPTLKRPLELWFKENRAILPLRSEFTKDLHRLWRYCTISFTADFFQK